MALIVNKNIGAMVAHRYLKMNESSFSKAVERLSSGMKINRAADDPAGLVISEKYRAQVEGLNQAIRNAQDGISLVQTAEGALDEVTSILRNMRNLALHAANTGASDAAAIAADQEQIEQGVATLDRIGNTTAFGTRKLLNGSSGVSASTDDADVTFISGGSNITSGTYGVNISAAAEQGIRGSAAALNVAQVVGDEGDGTGALTGAAKFTFDGALVGGAAYDLNFVGNETRAEIATAITNDSTLSGYGITAAVNGNNITISADRLSAAGAAELTVQSSTAELETVTGIDNTASDDSTATVATGSNKIRTAETLTFRDGAGTYVQVALTAGQTLSNVVTQVNTALDAAGLRVTAAFDGGTNVFTLTNDDYGAQANVLNTVESTLAGSVANTNLATAGSTQYNLAAGGGTGGNVGVDVDGTIGGYAATGSGLFLTGNSSTPVDGLVLKIAGGVSGAQGNVTVTQGALNFQVGAFQGQTVKLALNDTRADKLGTSATGTTYMSTINISSLDVTAGNGAGSQDAIIVIDAAITQITSMRSQMGSYQKDVLESSVRNLTVASQNMAASESAIRDADMAQEMLNFSRAQILSSTGMAMLAQANMAPQSIMRLFG